MQAPPDDLLDALAAALWEAWGEGQCGRWEAVPDKARWAALALDAVARAGARGVAVDVRRAWTGCGP